MKVICFAINCCLNVVNCSLDILTEIFEKVFNAFKALWRILWTNLWRFRGIMLIENNKESKTLEKYQIWIRFRFIETTTRTDVITTTKAICVVLFVFEMYLPYLTNRFMRSFVSNSFFFDGLEIIHKQRPSIKENDYTGLLTQMVMVTS